MYLPKQHKKMFVRSIAVASLLSLALQTFADTAEEKGLAIATRNDHSDLGFKDSEVSMKMVLRNAAGQETQRTLALKTMEKVNDEVGDKSLIVFDSPADIDGTALLSYAKILDADDQWLYLPALKRVKRISSVNKSGPFVGSEFAFEDFTSQELNKFTYKYIRSEACGDLQCDVVERYPRYEHSGYTKQVTWLDTRDFQVRKVEFYDRRGDLLKTLTLKDYRKYADKYWRPHTLSMINHQTNKQTELMYSDYKFRLGLSDNDFNQNALKHVR